MKCFEALAKDVGFEALDNVKARWIFKVRSGTAKAGKRKRISQSAKVSRWGRGKCEEKIAAVQTGLNMNTS